ncbi:DUF1294 domain-containing protein [Heyndrickxia acidicola]|uniref:DUF1294 domain-containing protein n=1 Tax=Heyndrickxia acidicola TaxID=209389 RepID=A0ABU6MRQ7_9BACI|nr:DUF1294 domain-containing protein [Heyndrickxia acidicola]MED1205725.1 DUF1294 domain-containing protein [Heyndrickxia acidicola]
MIQLVFIYYLVINVLGLFLMYTDKKKAINGQYRIREATLWRVAIFGGGVGSTIGMEMFRHKTKHPSFKYGFPSLAIIQIVIVIYLANLRY